MKWSKFVSTSDEFVEGEWNVIDDGSGLKLKSSQLGRQWDNQMIRHDLIEQRNPQDFLRSKEEQPIPWGRTEAPDVFTNGTNDGSDL